MKTLIILLFLAQSTVGFAQDRSDVKKVLTRSLDRVSARTTNVSPEVQRKEMLGGNGRVLNPKEIAVMRDLIAASECQFVGVDDNPIASPDHIRVQAPSCSTGNTILKECIGKIKCTTPALDYYIGGRCFQKDTNACPDAKTCALQSDFRFKEKNQTDAGSKENFYYNLWAWGVDDEN